MARAVSAFKLLQIDDSFDVFTGVKHVVDLCAAPGSVERRSSARQGCGPARAGRGDVQAEDMPKIVAIDLQPMAPNRGRRAAARATSPRMAKVNERS